MSYFTSTGDATLPASMAVIGSGDSAVLAAARPVIGTGVNAVRPPTSARDVLINAEQWAVAYRYPIGGALAGGLLVYLLMRKRK